MGRAIVREPKAFLMDEPLSNLDAKLRVQMRSEIARIQHDLNVTTIYVTHDQVEAMTMGDRVAVIRKGKLQQVDTPQNLYDHPLNLFVAGFIGSPAMNMVGATLSTSNGSATVEFGGLRLGVPAEVVAAHSGLSRFEGKPVVVGLRPEDIEDASLVPQAPEDRRIRTGVDLRESLGADVVVHFTVQAPAVVTEDTKELARDVGHDRLEGVEQAAGSSEFVARLNPRTTATTGQPIDLVVDVTRLHFFDPETGLAIYGDDGA
jgi:multiple sugar transport system ATP-binding protein